MKHLLTSVFVGLAGIQGLTLEATARPKLVVGIIVDQLRTDYLETLQDKFGSGGFRLLMDKGAYVKDVDFKVPEADLGASVAIIQTGSYPRQNGITGANIYSPSEKQSASVFTDAAYIGNFTDETYSPAALRVTTLTDEIAIDNNGLSKIHTIAPDAEEAIVLSGHAGTSAFWVNDETGRWSSTTYYKGAPVFLQNKNYNSPLLSRVDTMRWMPLKKADSYPGVSPSRIEEGFRYTFPKNDRNIFRLYKTSPYVNSDITEAATEYLKTLNLGKNSLATDVLNLGYTLQPYVGISRGDGKYEIEDSYLRLDKDLENLFTQLDRSVGLDNVLVYVASTGFFTEPERDMEQFRLPTGTFSVKRALSLLNSYLAAKYGNGSYVDQYYNGHIYLDRNGIEEKLLNLNAVTEDARDFLVRMSGVTDAYTIADLQSPSVAQLEGHRLANDPRTSGDIVMEFNPGWKVIDDTRYPPEPKIERTAAYPAPLFIMGEGIAPQVVTEPVDATRIAPTVARILRIRSPNSSVSKPLDLTRK